MSLLLIVLPIVCPLVLIIWCACAVSSRCDNPPMRPLRQHPYYTEPSRN